MEQALPLREVVTQLAIKQQQLRVLDAEISRVLAAIAARIRRGRAIGGPVDVTFPPWGRLGWSGRRGHSWRLVVVDTEACVDLLVMPRACRVAACGVLRELVARLGMGTRAEGQNLEALDESI